MRSFVPALASLRSFFVRVLNRVITSTKGEEEIRAAETVDGSLERALLVSPKGRSTTQTSGIIYDRL